MLEAWGLESSDWWLPNDEACPPIIRSIKDFILERTTAPKDQTSEDLREMRGIFSTLNISDSPSPENKTDEGSTSFGVGGAGGGGGGGGAAGVPASLDETLIYTGGSPDSAGWTYDAERYPGSDPGLFPGL